MENLIGRKVKGFKFENGDDIGYVSRMDEHIGEVGVIESFDKINKTFRVQFKDNYWLYPLSEINNHLVEEFERGELVETRDDGDEWKPMIFLTEIEGAKFPYVCVATMDEENFKNNKPFGFNSWKHIRKIKTKITLKEISEKFGVDVDKIEIVE